MSEEASGASPPKNEAQAETLSFAERIETQRRQIFKAMSIIEACRMGSDSMLAPLCGAEEADFGDALAAAHDLLGAVADELEAIGEPA